MDTIVTYPFEQPESSQLDPSARPTARQLKQAKMAKRAAARLRDLRNAQIGEARNGTAPAADRTGPSER